MRDLPAIGRLELRELDLVVDALDFRDRGGNERTDGDAIGDRQGDDIC